MGADEGCVIETARNDLSQMKGLKELKLLVSNDTNNQERGGAGPPHEGLLAAVFRPAFLY